jgi:hypothetical protein
MRLLPRTAEQLRIAVDGKRCPGDEPQHEEPEI